MPTTQEVLDKLSQAEISANELLQYFQGARNSIDQRVEQFRTDAHSLVEAETANIIRANIGIVTALSTTVTALPNVDVAPAIKQAYADGFKHVRVNWNADGLERHWNELVSLPVGCTLDIMGPDSTVTELGGLVRADRACYANGLRGGVSENGSPMIFRNLEINPEVSPMFDHYQVKDETSLISMSGNNMVVFGDGTYLHDEGGMLLTPYQGGLIRILPYHYGLTNVISGGGSGAQLFLSSSLVNHNKGATGDLAIRFTLMDMSKTSSDGPSLTVNKGFKRLLNEGEVGVTADLLKMQPYEVPLDKANLNDNLFVGYTQTYFNNVREVVDALNNINNPRLLSNNSWAHPGGVVTFQSGTEFSNVSSLGFSQHGTSSVFVANV